MSAETGANGAAFTQSDAATEPTRYLAAREAHLVKMSNALSPSLASQAQHDLGWFRADVLAARAEIATAERARLAGMASEEDREMVQHYGYLATEAHRANCSGEACCEAPDRRDANKAEAEALALILARLAAARGEDDLLPACCGEYGVKRMAYCGACPLDEALAAYVGNPAQRRIVLDRLTTLRARLAAVEGERDAAERRGAERALRWAWRNEGAVCTEPEDELLRLALAALFPPPGAEVGRG